ncbi:DUF4136 domain-containing protein [Carboxylicivirga sp. N1Y90]|uniref:DUF4136 domain-containing protein n=1 Tax=Carboxylicivirga fragile TaxID=3417571 RepID=UPI003D35677B|nr:DUF4136 domain-containing protein [Marinilabiliaceae bacterium N1Y90]
MRTKMNFLAIAALIFMVNACYPGGAEYVDELDTTISKFDPNYKWNTLDVKTYIMPEAILHLKDGDPVDDPNDEYDAEIMKQVRENMNAQGLEEYEGEDPSQANLIVALTLIEQNNTGAAWYPGGGWWGGWYPGYPGWGWGGYYPWYPVYYNYKTGSFMMELGNMEAAEDDEVPSIYIGAVDGLLQGSTEYLQNRIDRGIDELFNQDPFN